MDAQEGLLGQILRALRASQLPLQEKVQARRESVVEIVKRRSFSLRIASHGGVGRRFPRSRAVTVAERFDSALPQSRKDRRFAIFEFAAPSLAQDTLPTGSRA